MATSDSKDPVIYFLCQEGFDRSLCIMRSFCKFLELSDYQGPVLKVGRGSIYDDDIVSRIGAEDVVVVYGHVSDSDFDMVRGKSPYKDNIIKAEVPRGAVDIIQNWERELEPAIREGLMVWGRPILAKIQLAQSTNGVQLKPEAKIKLKC